MGKEEASYLMMQSQQKEKREPSFLVLGLLIEGLLLGLDGLSRLWVHLPKIVLASCSRSRNLLLLGAGMLYI